MNKRVFASSDCANSLKNLGKDLEFFGLPSIIKRFTIFDYADCLMKDTLSFNIALSIAHPVSVVRGA